MSNYQNKLETNLWAIADELRGGMDASEFKNYVLGFIFYKYLSEKLELFLDEKLTQRGGGSFSEEYDKSDRTQKNLEKMAIKGLGYFIEPKHLFSTMIKNSDPDSETEGFILDDLRESLDAISNSSLGHESQDDFSNLFEDVNLNSSKLGTSANKRNEKIIEILKRLNAINFKIGDKDVDILGDAYEYLISRFASDAGRDAGEFYTPQPVSKILARITTAGKTKIDSVYDATCGSGSLLLTVSKEVNVNNIYGQEKNPTTYNLARMNMILHDIKYKDFDIRLGDSIEEPQHDINMRCEAIVANPPFSQKWSKSNDFLDDPRFSAYGVLPPKSKEDFAFVQHMLHYLDENGTMAIVLPHGVLFRGNAELKIRKYLIDTKNYLDAVIGLPADVFYGTSIPTCILIFKKCRNEDVLFIDASNDFERVDSKNKLREEDIDKIVNTYINREEIEKYSHKTTLEEI
ncbi:MAG: type I restriction-modification system subunit M, partial [archaeon]|nr:type I restriction-modification system subunit M [archaeon]